MKTLWTLAVCLFFSFISVALCYPGFASKIPNGYIVPCPQGCQCNTPYWTAVGHYHNSRHTLAKNPFGKDFRLHRFQWTAELCQADSDGDGYTNGQELGDPQCQWTPGNRMVLSTPTGHPGICEPVGDIRCQHSQFTCGCLINQRCNIQLNIKN